MFYDPTLKPETKVEPWRDNALRAAEIIAKRGHTQDTLQDGHGRLCLYGALNFAAHGEASWCWTRINEGQPSHPEITAALNELLGTVGERGNVEWNNAPDRTAAEVIAALQEVGRGR